MKKGTTDICIIENGGQAVNRNDIIVIEYVKDEATRLESHTTKVIKGVPAEVAVDPELVTGDINAGAVLHQMPLYRVKIEGLNVVAVEQMFEIGSVAAETVNPMEATEEGFAADALAVKNQFSEQNKNLTASDNLKFRFATDGEGNYGYLAADDSFVPFKSNLVLEYVELSTHGTAYGIDYSTITLDVSKHKTLTVTGSMYHVTGGWLDIKNSKDGNKSIGTFNSYSETTKTFDVSAYEKIKLAVERPGQGGGNWTAFYGKIELS